MNFESLVSKVQEIASVHDDSGQAKGLDFGGQAETGKDWLDSLDQPITFDIDKWEGSGENLLSPLEQMDQPLKFDMQEKDIQDTGEKNTAEKIKCKNEDLEGKRHPDTGVPFEKRLVEVDGKLYEVVVPRFNSTFDAQLSPDKLKETDAKQFKECNAQLKDAVASNKELREKFDDEQLEQIENGDTPDGYTWHHDADVGKMQLVDTETHQKTGHTGGRAVWGGGTDYR